MPTTQLERVAKRIGALALPADARTALVGTLLGADDKAKAAVAAILVSQRLRCLAWCWWCMRVRV